MKQFKNMKFKVDSLEQSDRLQAILRALGYVNYGDDTRCIGGIVTYKEALYQTIYLDDYYKHNYEAQNTTAFLAAHEPAPAQEPETFFGDDAKELGWFDNTGAMPDLPEGTLLDVLYLNCNGSGQSEVENFDWKLGEGAYTIAKWRYHRSEKPEEYFVQPKTEPKINFPSSYEGTPELAAVEKIIEGFKEPKRNKYMREIKPGVFCDVYDVLRAFNVTDGALAHMVKKCLAVGQRGHKDATEDYKDIVASAQRALELHLEWKESA